MKNYYILKNLKRNIQQNNNEKQIDNIKQIDIPKILHLTCKDKNNINNLIWQNCIKKYKEIYLDYKITIYDNDDIYNIIKINFPEYLEKIRQIKVGAVLADIFRYLILYLEGGIYSDMDCEPLKKIDELLNDHTFFHGNTSNNFYIYPEDLKLKDIKQDFNINPCNNCELINNDIIKTYKCLGHNINKPSTILCYEFHKDWHNKCEFLSDNKWTSNNVGICQWFIITEPKQEIFLNMFLDCIKNIDTLIDLDRNDKDYHILVINNCGPLAFTKLILNNLSDNIYILPSDFFCAGSWNNMVPQTKNSFVKHHFTASWL